MTEQPLDLWTQVPPKGSSVELPIRDILGINVTDLTLKDALNFVHGRLVLKLFTPITFLNAHNANIAQQDQKFAQALRSFTVLSDGVGVDLAARILYGAKFQANLNGTDFIPALLKSSPHPLKIALYGAQPGIVEKAADAFNNIENKHTYRVAGHGYIDRAAQDEMLNELLAWKPDIVLVAKGVPAQELWITENLTEEHCTLAFGIGALFDFYSGEISRAPIWMRAIRLEWLYRLIREPMRMWRRYIIGNPVFLFQIAKQKFGWVPRARAPQTND